MKTIQYCLLGAFLICCPLFANGQAFIFNQLFRPSLRMNTEYVHDFNNNKDQLHTGRANINLIVPIKSKLDLKVKWGNILKIRKWKDVKKVAKIKAYQIFWNFRPQFSYLNFQPKDAGDYPFAKHPQLNYGFSTGITGIHLLPKMKLLFYTINVGMNEDLQSIRKPHPSGNLLLGIAHANRLIFYWYYGLYVSYSNGRVLPAPFIGIQANIAKRLWLNITLPVQLRLSWKASKKVKLDFVTGISGFSGGFGLEDLSKNVVRYDFSAFQVRSGLMFTAKLGKQASLYLEAGMVPYRQVNWNSKNKIFEKPELGYLNTYGALSLFFTFHKSLLSSTIDQIVIF
ncbi:MAG: hypothetical protein GY810_29350 [Aureispira sp.]|nr:hypothetical protein [Aureispira sp.]